MVYNIIRYNFKGGTNMGKKLVAYFSAEGHTAKVAKSVAKQAGAELFEIAPSEPYTLADINWKNPLSRCNKEKLGKKDVPVAGEIENFDEYDTVFIGFPIWYYTAPNVVATFIKQYDWSGKKVALFATSGGSDIAKTAEKISPLFVGGEVVSSKLFKPSDSPATVKEWLESIEL